jgi:hypothetical protein
VAVVLPKKCYQYSAVARRVFPGAAADVAHRGQWAGTAGRGVRELRQY